MDVPAQVMSAFKIEKTVSMETDSETFKVDTGIPFVTKEKKSRSVRDSIYPFSKMRPPRENGDMDSFFVRDRKDKTDVQNKQRIASAIHDFGKRNPKFKGQFKYRHVGDGIRVWRVK